MTQAFLWLQGNPVVVLAFVIAVLVVYLARKGRRSRSAAKDPQRLFKASQKAEAGRRCGHGRCEHKEPLWFRCRANGSHGDHIYPHSRGGATTMSNLQLLCPTHNLRKSAHVPSSIYIWRLQRRRARYFPAGVSGKVEWRLGRAW